MNAIPTMHLDHCDLQLSTPTPSLFRSTVPAKTSSEGRGRKKDVAGSLSGRSKTVSPLRKSERGGVGKRNRKGNPFLNEFTNVLTTYGTLPRDYQKPVKENKILACESYEDIKSSASSESSAIESTGTVEVHVSPFEPFEKARSVETSEDEDERKQSSQAQKCAWKMGFPLPPLLGCPSGGIRTHLEKDRDGGAVDERNVDKTKEPFSSKTDDRYRELERNSGSSNEASEEEDKERTPRARSHNASSMEAGESKTVPGARKEAHSIGRRKNPLFGSAGLHNVFSDGIRKRPYIYGLNEGRAGHSLENGVTTSFETINGNGNLATRSPNASRQSLQQRSALVNGSNIEENRARHTATELAVTMILTYILKPSGNLIVRYRSEIETTIVGDDSAELFAFSIIMHNGVNHDETYDLDRGQCVIFLRNQVPPSDGTAATLTIIRHAADVSIPLEIYMEIEFPLIGTSRVNRLTVCVPTLRPRVGIVRRERIFLPDAGPPLVMEAVSRNATTGWEMKRPSPGTSMFERARQADAHYPSLIDDICLLFHRWPIIPLQRELWRSLNTPSAEQEPQLMAQTAWDLDIKLLRALGATICCRMSVSVIVNSSGILLKVDPCGWLASYFTVNGRHVFACMGDWDGEWQGKCLQDDEGKYSIMKQPGMEFGSVVRVGMCWLESPLPEVCLREELEKDHQRLEAVYEANLPRIDSHSLDGVQIESGVEKGMPRHSAVFKLAVRRLTGFSHLPGVYLKFKSPNNEHRRIPISAREGSVLLPSLQRGEAIEIQIAPTDVVNVAVSYGPNAGSMTEDSLSDSESVSRRPKGSQTRPESTPGATTVQSGRPGQKKEFGVANWFLLTLVCGFCFCLCVRIWTGWEGFHEENGGEILPFAGILRAETIPDEHETGTGEDQDPYGGLRDGLDRLLGWKG